ncbi:hypothetical protein [Telmatospirillum sp.]|uniref:hypothetical protein n=1 Tax=Telmatospirillum sp. TaxID=2079197 RepID=UPI002846B45F|nr:hypothetical protein [Telmatospirillum sp.]MDR3438872.1 hypothetical protein [Telmatospirillum sp.]
MLVETAGEHSPVGGLSDSLYQKLSANSELACWTKSPIGGLSLPEFLRIAGLDE